jgi:chromosomal replication initiator protein
LHNRSSKGFRITLPLSLKDTQILLSDLIQTETKRAVTKEKIVQIVAKFYGITTEDILGKSQSREYSFPRKVAIFLCRQELKLAYSKIGEFFKRDHSTIMSCVETISTQQEKELSLAGALSSILKELNTAL